MPLAQASSGGDTCQGAPGADVRSPSGSHLHGPGLLATRSLSPSWQQAGTLLGARACGLAGLRLRVGASPPRGPRRTGSQASPLSPALTRGQEACQPPELTNRGQLCHRRILGHTSATCGAHSGGPADVPRGCPNPAESLWTWPPGPLGAPQLSDKLQGTWGQQSRGQDIPLPRPGGGGRGPAAGPSPPAPRWPNSGLR